MQPNFFITNIFRASRLAAVTINLLFVSHAVGLSLPTWTSRKQKKQAYAQKHELKPNKSLKDIRAVEEAIKAAEYYESLGDHDLMVNAYQRVISLARDPDIAATYLMKLADAYFTHGNLDEAKKQYQRFISLYPQHQLIERAHYREITTYFMSALSSRRDQSATKMVISLGKKYLKSHASNLAACAQISSMIAASYTKLAQHEVEVAKFYLNKHYLEQTDVPLRAAGMRLQHCIKTLIPDIMQFIPRPDRVSPIPEAPAEVAAVTREGELLAGCAVRYAAYAAQLDAFIITLIPSAPDVKLGDRF